MLLSPLRVDSTTVPPSAGALSPPSKPVTSTGVVLPDPGFQRASLARTISSVAARSRSGSRRASPAPPAAPDCVTPLDRRRCRRRSPLPACSPGRAPSRPACGPVTAWGRSNVPDPAGGTLRSVGGCRAGSGLHRQLQAEPATIGPAREPVDTLREPYLLVAVVQRVVGVHDVRNLGAAADTGPGGATGAVRSEEMRVRNATVRTRTAAIAAAAARTGQLRRWTAGSRPGPWASSGTVAAWVCR